MKSSNDSKKTFNDNEKCYGTYVEGQTDRKTWDNGHTCSSNSKPSKLKKLLNNFYTFYVWQFYAILRLLSVKDMAIQNLEAFEQLNN